MHRIGIARWALSAAVALALVAAFAAVYATRSSGASARLVTTAKNTTLGKRVLVDRKGRTLYSLSVERRGRYVCKTASCLAFWKPLVVRTGTKPTGVAGLATVRRPDGRIQVTYRGRPLYTFYLDRKRGDAKGEGIKDVGTWHAASVARVAGTGTPTPMPPGGGYGGGY